VEGGLDDREAPRREQGGADPLERPGHDQRWGVGGHAADQGRAGKPENADHEQSPAAVAITERAAEQQQPGQGERIGVHDPLKAREADAEVLADGGERDIDDRRVEHHEARAEHRDQQDPPPSR